MDKNKVKAKVMRKLAEEDIERRLKKHDWQYEMADDQRAWSAGKKEEKAILQVLAGMDPEEAFDLWNKHAPSNGKLDKTKFNRLMEINKVKK